MSSSFSCSVSVNPSNLLPEAPKQVEHTKHLPRHLEGSKTQAGEEKLKKSQAAAHDALQKERDGKKEERKGKEEEKETERGLWPPTVEEVREPDGLWKEGHGHSNCNVEEPTRIQNNWGLFTHEDSQLV